MLSVNHCWIASACKHVSSPTPPPCSLCGKHSLGEGKQAQSNHVKIGWEQNIGKVRGGGWGKCFLDLFAIPFIFKQPQCQKSPSFVQERFYTVYLINSSSSLPSHAGSKENTPSRFMHTETRVRSMHSIFASEFWQIWSKLNLPCDSDKCNGNKIFVCSKHSCMEAIVNNSIVETVLKTQVLLKMIMTVAKDDWPSSTYDPDCTRLNTTFKLCQWLFSTIAAYKTVTWQGNQVKLLHKVTWRNAFAHEWDDIKWAWIPSYQDGSHWHHLVPFFNFFPDSHLESFGFTR